MHTKLNKYWGKLIDDEQATLKFVVKEILFSKSSKILKPYLLKILLSSKTSRPSPFLLRPLFLISKYSTLLTP